MTLLSKLSYSTRKKIGVGMFIATFLSSGASFYGYITHHSSTLRGNHAYLYEFDSEEKLAPRITDLKSLKQSYEYNKLGIFTLSGIVLSPVLLFSGIIFYGSGISEENDK